MTTVISFADATDGRLASGPNSYATALAGSGTVTADTTTGALGTVGQTPTGSTYTVFEYFASFPYSVNADEVPVAAYLELIADTTTGAAERDLQLREFDWGTSLTAADWRTPAQLGALPLLGVLDGAQDVPPAATIRVAGSGLLTRLDRGGPIRTVLSTDLTQQSKTPSSSQYTQLRTADYAGTASDPVLVYTAVPVHLMNRLQGGQVQLSTGEQAVIAAQYPDSRLQTMYLYRRGLAGASLYLSDWWSEGATRRGAQSYAIACDDDDNLYIVSGGEDNYVYVRTYRRGGTGYWADATSEAISPPGYLGRTNSVAVVWLPRGTDGTLLVLVGHTADRRSGTSQAYVLINCHYLLTGSGDPLRGSGSTNDVLVDNYPPPGGVTYNNYVNETGTLLDVSRAPDSAFRVFLASAAQNATLRADGYPSVARALLASGGDGIDTSAVGNDPAIVGGARLTKDAGGQARVLGTSTTSFAVCTADATKGLVVNHLRNIPPDTTLVNLCSVALTPSVVSGFPAPSAIATSQAWDAIYDPSVNKVWIYYIDTAAPLRLMRTGVNLTTGLADATTVIVKDPVGTGGTHRAVRVQRNPIVSRPILVCLANINGTAHTVYTVDDALSRPPTAPKLNARANFNAANATTFSWVFGDPDTGDTQSAYQLQIVRADTGAVAFDSGKTVSTAASHTLTAGVLTNELSYQWRVATWDAADNAGPFSTYGAFATSASGNVTITVPAADNPPGQVNDTILVSWTVAGATQAAYRVKLVRLADGATISDTDWVGSTATSFLVSGMESDVQYRIDVTVRNAAQVASSTGSRLVITSYAKPPQPTITVTDDPTYARIRVAVQNPPPAAATPNLLTNPAFETDTTGWSVSGGTVARSTGQAHSGTGSALLTPSGSASMPQIGTTLAASPTITPGERYRFSSWVYAPSGWPQVRVELSWRTSADSEVAVTYGATVAAPTGAWLLLTVEGNAPAAAAVASGRVDMLGTPVPAQYLLYVDDAELVMPSDVQQVTMNRIYRRLTDSGDAFAQIGATGINGVYDDYLVASKRSYDYQVRAYSPTGGRWSDTASARVDFKGVWLHDPTNPATTLLSYPYGPSNRTSTVEVASGSQQYAGRTFPVIDFGENETEALEVAVLVPRGDGWDWQTQVRPLALMARSRRTLVCRDNRGRVLVGALSGYQEKDNEIGTDVSFTVNRVNTTLVV